MRFYCGPTHRRLPPGERSKRARQVACPTKPGKSAAEALFGPAVKMAGFQGAKGYSDSFRPPLRRPKSTGMLLKGWSADLAMSRKRMHRVSSSASGAGATRGSNWLPAMMACLLLVWILWTVGTVVIPLEVALTHSENGGHGGPELVVHHHQPLLRNLGNDLAQQSRKDAAGNGDRPAPMQQASMHPPPDEGQKEQQPVDPLVITQINRLLRPTKHRFGDGEVSVGMASVTSNIKAARMRLGSKGQSPLDARRDANRATPPPRLPIPRNGTLLLLENASGITLPGSNDPVQCVAWRQTGDCSPDGPREPQNDKACNEHIPDGAAGYCEVIDRRSNPRGELSRVMQMHCDSYPYSEISRTLISCGTAWEFADFSERSLRFRPNPSLQLQPELLDMPFTSKHGIVFCVADSMMVSAYAAINVMRSEGCMLPIELWYFPDEITRATNRIVTSLVKQHHVSMRPIKVSRAEICHEQGNGKCFNVKVYAIYHTSFESVLLLDTDNFVLRDPSYLFDAPEFRDTGAIFWPDFWSPHNTIFNVWNSSMVWELTGVPFVDMHEQESGQLLINRRRHARALDVLMFYATPDNILYRYGPVYGDKDLFRLAWMRAGEPFHMIQQPPGWAGQQKDNNPIGFCGNTMVQYGPEGEKLFMHRNGFKLDRLKRSRVPIWDAVVEWEGGEGATYWSSTTAVKRRYGYAVNPCYGPPADAKGYKRLGAPEFRALQTLEESILEHANEAAHMVAASNNEWAASNPAYAKRGIDV